MILLEGFLDLLFPRGLTCLACGAPIPRGRREELCGDCLLSPLRISRATACPRCGAPKKRGQCSHHLEFLDETHCALRHEGSARDLVHKLKYEHLRLAAEPLAAEMARAVQGNWDLLAPIPLHARRQRERGYNQAECLARPVSETAGIPLSRPLIRAKSTAQQIHLSAPERRANMAGAFHCPTQVPGLRILLVDDVCTTGATADAAAAALKQAGASRVGLLTATHALEYGDGLNGKPQKKPKKVRP